MKSVSTLGVLALLLFACKLCSFTSGNRNTPPPSPTPTPPPQLFVADILTSKLGSFTVTKRRSRDEMLKAFSSDPTLRSMVEESNDAGTGAYNSERGETALICVFSFPSPNIATAELEKFENDIRGSYRWRNVKSTSLAHGKRLEGTDSKSRAAVIWTNGYWLFWAWSGDAELTNSFVDAVGY